MDERKAGRYEWMRTIEGQPPVRVKWFLAAPGAKLYEGLTRFRGSDYAYEHEWDGIGVVEGPSCCGRRPTVGTNGNAPAPYTGEGPPCGSDAVAYRGAIPGVDPVFWTNELGQPPCCDGGILAHMSGGSMEGGYALVGGAVVLAAGGSEEGGPSALAITMQAAGGLAMGGIADQVAQAVMEAAGGLAVGGAATALVQAVMEAAGGLAVGGAATALVQAVMAGAGGLAVGGAATALVQAVMEAAGGLAVGGAATALVQAVMAGAGGLAVGGAATALVQAVMEAAGGLAVGGAATALVQAVMAGAGGLAVGGAATMSASGGGTCPTSNTYTVVIAGVAGPGACASSNGTWHLTNVGGQVWRQAAAFVTVTLILTASPYQLTVSGAFGANYQAVAFNCSGSNVFSLVGTSGFCTGWPATLTVTFP